MPAGQLICMPADLHACWAADLHACWAADPAKVNPLSRAARVRLPAMLPHPTNWRCTICLPAGDQLVIDADSLRVLKHVKAAHMTFATSVAFSPDEQYIISGEG